METLLLFKASYIFFKLTQKILLTLDPLEQIIYKPQMDALELRFDALSSETELTILLSFAKDLIAIAESLHKTVASD